MKKLFILLLTLFASYNASAQWIFGKNPLLNKPDWDKQRVHYGYYIGLSSLNFSFDYDKDYYDKMKSLTALYGGTDVTEIQVTSNTGFNVGLVGNLRLSEYLDLRFEPGLVYTKRDLQFPSAMVMDYFAHKSITTLPTAAEIAFASRKSISSTYIHFPLLLKFSALRTGNIRPYVIGGFSYDLNLSANQNSEDDNYDGVWRMKQWTSNYELGVGIDIYFEYFKLSPSIRGVFGLNDELIRDNNAASPWTGGINSMKTRGVFINFTVH